MRVWCIVGQEPLLLFFLFFFVVVAAAVVFVAVVCVCVCVWGTSRLCVGFLQNTSI